jgi:O-methyltransferase involved in polyketide biosynthesis
VDKYEPDVGTPNVARIYDYFLGGKDNYAVDREAAEQLTAMIPALPLIARQNRAFVGRAVRVLARDYGIRQFIDVGAGLPTQASVHSIARAIAPDATVVYVDNDPVVCSHGRALLQGQAIGMVEADLRQPDSILRHPVTRTLINFAEPVAVLLTAVLHFLPDEANPRAIIARFRDAMAPGSALVISHGTLEGGPVDDRAQYTAQIYRQASAALTLRRLDEVLGFFDGFELIEPGLAWITQWHPDAAAPPASPVTLRGGVGLLPG